MSAQRDIFHDGEDVVAYACMGNAEQVVVSFAPWSVEPLGHRDAIHAKGFGDGAFRKRGLGEIHVVARANHWYQSAEMYAIFDRIVSMCEGRQLVCYGPSMGAHAAIVASGFIDAHFVALAPQFSIDRRVVPEECRWVEEADRITFDPRLVPDGRGPGGYVFYDPYTKADRIQGERVAALYPDKVATCPFSGHSLTAHAQAVYGLSRMVAEVLDGSFSVESFHRARRAKRSDDPVYLGNLVATCIRQGKSVFAERHENQLLAHPNLGIREIVKLVYAYNRRGQKSRALELCEQCLERGFKAPIECILLGKALKMLCAEEMTRTLHRYAIGRWPATPMLDQFFAPDELTDQAASKRVA